MSYFLCFTALHNPFYDVILLISDIWVMQCYERVAHTTGTSHLMEEHRLTFKNKERYGLKQTIYL